MTLAQQLEEVREHLLGCSRPLILFDDDPDGLASFLLLYRMVRAGKGMPLKGTIQDEMLARRVNEYCPDVVVVLDKPEMSQEFFDDVKAPCIWIDHHEPQHAHGVTYINPRMQNKNNNIPTSRLCYDISKKDAWIATIGVVSDWQLPDDELWSACEEMCREYLPRDVKDAPTALFTTKIGELARVFSFNLKGRASDVLSSLKILTRIKEPSELLEKKNAQARLIMRKYEKLLGEYKDLLQRVAVDKNDPVVLFEYDNDANSFTVDISNELLHKHPDKLIIIARKSNGSYKCSLRSSKLSLNTILDEILVETGGTGGGHEHACGAVILEDQFERFVQLLREKAKK